MGSVEHVLARRAAEPTEWTEVQDMSHFDFTYLEEKLKERADLPKKRPPHFTADTWTRLDLKPDDWPILLEFHYAEFPVEYQQWMRTLRVGSIVPIRTSDQGYIGAVKIVGVFPEHAPPGCALLGVEPVAD